MVAASRPQLSLRESVQDRKKTPPAAEYATASQRPVKCLGALQQEKKQNSLSKASERNRQGNDTGGARLDRSGVGICDFHADYREAGRSVPESDVLQSI